MADNPCNSLCYYGGVQFSGNGSNVQKISNIQQTFAPNTFLSLAVISHANTSNIIPILCKYIYIYMYIYIYIYVGAMETRVERRSSELVASTTMGVLPCQYQGVEHDFRPYQVTATFNESLILQFEVHLVCR